MTYPTDHEIVDLVFDSSAEALDAAYSHDFPTFSPDAEGERDRVRRPSVAVRVTEDGRTEVFVLCHRVDHGPSGRWSDWDHRWIWQQMHRDEP